MWMSETEASLPRMTSEYIPAAFARDEINFPFPEESTNAICIALGEVHPIMECAIFISLIGTESRNI
jgi:hypothetical protein